MREVANASRRRLNLIGAERVGEGGGGDLTEEEIVATIMRSENWLVAMIRDGRVFSPHLVLTKTVEFALSFTVLQFIYDQGRNSSGGGGGREELEAEVDRPRAAARTPTSGEADRLR